MSFLIQTLAKQMTVTTTMNNNRVKTIQKLKKSINNVLQLTLLVARRPMLNEANLVNTDIGVRPDART